MPQKLCTDGYKWEQNGKLLSGHLLWKYILFLTLLLIIFKWSFNFYDCLIFIFACQHFCLFYYLLQLNCTSAQLISISATTTLKYKRQKSTAGNSLRRERSLSALMWRAHEKLSDRLCGWLEEKDATVLQMAPWIQAEFIIQNTLYGLKLLIWKEILITFFLNVTGWNKPCWNNCPP